MPRKNMCDLMGIRDVDPGSDWSPAIASSKTSRARSLDSALSKTPFAMSRHVRACNDPSFVRQDAATATGSGYFARKPLRAVSLAPPSNNFASRKSPIGSVGTSGTGRGVPAVTMKELRSIPKKSSRNLSPSPWSVSEADVPIQRSCGEFGSSPSLINKLRTIIATSLP